MSIHQPPDPDMAIDVRASLPVDPRIVDINLLSEAFSRIVGSMGTLLQVLHAQDATDFDKEVVTRVIHAMVARVEFEMKPLYKDSIDAVKH